MVVDHDPVRSTVGANHTGAPAAREMREHEASNATPARRYARPPAAGEVIARLARTWNTTMMTVPVSMVAEMSHRGAAVADTSHSGIAP
jgi:hypothetical protein